MTLLSTFKTRRAVAGMVAVAAGTATVAAPMVALPLSAAPGGDTTISPAASGDYTGTYQSCSALFGLTDKTNANYVTFNVAGTADPLPGIGKGLTPVITVTDPESGDVDECTPEIGFNDAESWLAYIDATGFEENPELVVPYPGTTGYLVPISENVFTPAGTAAPAEPAPAPLSIALRIETDSSVDPTFTVTWDPSTLSYPVSPSLGEIVEMIEMELGGPTSPLAILLNDILMGDFPLCFESPDQTIQELLTAAITVTGISQSLLDSFTDDTCGQLLLAMQFGTLQQSVASLGLRVAVTVNAPAPAPNPDPAPTPATPRFTG